MDIYGLDTCSSRDSSIFLFDNESEDMQKQEAGTTVSHQNNNFVDHNQIEDNEAEAFVPTHKQFSKRALLNSRPSDFYEYHAQDSPCEAQVSGNLGELKQSFLSLQVAHQEQEICEKLEIVAMASQQLKKNFADPGDGISRNSMTTDATTMNQLTFNSVPNLLSIREDVFSENEAEFVPKHPFKQKPSNLILPSIHRADSMSVN